VNKMPRKHNARRGKSRRYIINAIMETIPEDRWVNSRDLVEEVSRAADRDVSAHRIGAHLSILEDEGRVIRNTSINYPKWRRR
jgi:hypothetical protein